MSARIVKEILRLERTFRSQTDALFKDIGLTGSQAMILPVISLPHHWNNGA